MMLLMEEVSKETMPLHEQEGVGKQKEIREWRGGNVDEGARGWRAWYKASVAGNSVTGVSNRLESSELCGWWWGRCVRH